MKGTADSQQGKPRTGARLCLFPFSTISPKALPFIFRSSACSASIASARRRNPRSDAAGRSSARQKTQQYVEPSPPGTGLARGWTA
jgi:hypothetical protein